MFVCGVSKEPVLAPSSVWQAVQFSRSTSLMLSTIEATGESHSMHESSMFGISSKWSLLVDVELEKRISTGFWVVSSATNSSKVTPGSDVFNHWSRRCTIDSRSRCHALALLRGDFHQFRCLFQDRRNRNVHGRSRLGGRRLHGCGSKLRVLETNGVNAESHCRWW